MEFGFLFFALALGFGTMVLIHFLIKAVREIDNPYAFTQYFDPSLIKVKVFEVEPTEPLSEDNPKVSKIIFTERGTGIYGNEGFYYNGLLYAIPYELIVLSRTMKPSLFVARLGRYGIMPLLPVVVPSEIHEKQKSVELTSAGVYFPIRFKKKFEEEISKERERFAKTNTTLNLTILRPASEMLNYMTDSNITSFYMRQRSIIKKVESTSEQLVKFVATTGVIIIASVILIAVAIMGAENIITKAIQVAGGGG